MARGWITGWMLAEGDRRRLLALVPPKFPDVVADHVTLQVGADAATPLPTATRAEVVGEIDDGAGVQALVVRIDGTTDRPDGSTYHLTWSLDRAAGRSAKESNDVIAARGWHPLADTVAVALEPARWERGSKS